MEEIATIEEIVQKTLQPLGFEGRIEVFRAGQGFTVGVRAEDAGTLIGKGGENLRALQHLLLLMISKSLDHPFGPGEFSLDINDYKKERESYLVSLAKNVAYEVRETKHERELEPMPASERRVVHLTLASIDGVFTESVGEKKKRRIVVRPVL